MDKQNNQDNKKSVGDNDHAGLSEQNTPIAAAETAEVPKTQTAPNSNTGLSITHINEHLEFFTKLGSVLVMLAVVFGGMNIYGYLHKIEQTAVFPSVIGSTGSFIAMLVAFSIFWLAIAVGLLLPWYPHLFLKGIRKLPAGQIKYFLCYVHCQFIAMAGIMSAYTIWFSDDEKYLICMGIVAMVSTLICSAFWYKYARGQECWFEKLLLSLLISMMFILTQLIGILLLLEMIIFFAYNLIQTGVLFVVTLAIFGASTFFSCMTCSRYIKTGKYELTPSFLMLSLAFAMAYILASFSNYNIPLRQLGFIEKYGDAKWYLVANQGTKDEPRFLTSFTKEDLSVVKKLFEENCEALTDEKDKEKCKTIKEKENALYGYMAWNLGSERIFCPSSVDFFSDDNSGGSNEQKAEKCLSVANNQLLPIGADMMK